MRLGRTLADLSYWPRIYARGFFELWRDSGPALAVLVTAANLVGHRRAAWIRLHGFTIEIRTGSPDLMVAVDSLGDEFRVLEGRPDPGGLIIDAGGYIGTAALKFAALFPDSKIVTLEPSRQNRALLRRNVEGVANITVVGAALAADEGEALLRDAGSGEWGFSMVAAGDAIDTVPTVTVEALMAGAGRDALFLLKLDVEGAEREILAASDGWMGRTEIVIAELHEALAPGATAAFATATTGRINTYLPGEKVMSMRAP